MKDLPNQTTQPVGDGANGLRMPEPRDKPAIAKMVPLAFTAAFAA